MTDIFISYSHKDEKWKDALQRQLQVLQLHADFKVWDDRQIEMGDGWLKEIESAIAVAKVAILLVSPDFLISEFVCRQEIPKFLARRSEDGLRVIPLVVEPCPWRAVGWLASMQGATKDNEPLARHRWDSYELKSELSDVALKVFDQLKSAREEEVQSLEAEKQALAVGQQRLVDVKAQQQLRQQKEQVERERLQQEKEVARRKQEEQDHLSAQQHLEDEREGSAETAENWRRCESADLQRKKRLVGAYVLLVLFVGVVAWLSPYLIGLFVR